MRAYKLQIPDKADHMKTADSFQLAYGRFCDMLKPGGKVCVDRCRRTHANDKHG